MEQLTRTAQTGLSTGQIQNPYRKIEVSRIMKKIVITLSSQQIESLTKLMNFYFLTVPLDMIEDKAIYYLVYQVYEKKIRPKQIDLKSVYKLKLDIAQANAFMWMLKCLRLLEFAVYENTLRDYICNEIEHQTV